MGTAVQRPCSWCSGSGEVRTGPASATKEKCDVCGGLGYSVMDSDTFACRECDGTGEVTESKGLLDVILGSERRCPRCKGTGWAMPA
jgi:DnaJ-class molecular chaperone